MSDHIDVDPEVELKTADAAHDVEYMDDTDVMATWARIMQQPLLAEWVALTEEPDGTWRCSTTTGIVRRGNTQAAAVREFIHETDSFLFSFRKLKKSAF